MKEFTRLTVFSLIAATIVFTAPAAEQRTTLTIKADGSSILAVDKTESRALAEQQARRWERIRRQNLGEADDDAKPPEKQEAKPLTDEELAKKIREAAQAQAEQRGDDETAKIESVDVKSNTVRTVTTRSFASLEDMLRQSYVVWSQSGLSFENVKFDKDAEGHLRIALVPNPNTQRYAKNMRQQWKLTGAQTEMRLVLPGKILSSGFPATQENATWLAIDAQKPETIDAAMKLYQGSTVITAELAGLKLDRPLESKTLIRSRRSPADATDLPITDAGPGFATEPVAVTTTTLYYFPGGPTNLQQAGVYGAGQTGMIVRAKLFAPKGRTLQSVSDVRVLKAADDKGRAIPAGEGDGSDTSVSTVAYASDGGARPGNSTQISLRLQLPQADAQSIDELSGEAIALTVGKWKEVTLTNLVAGSTNEVDLADLLPGAKLSITKLTNKNRQLNVQARLTGPAEIRKIELLAKTSGRYSSSSSAYERSSSTRNGQSTRTLQLNQYSGIEEGDADQMPAIIVRFPEDQRRERVRFAFKALDLF